MNLESPIEAGLAAAHAHAAAPPLAVWLYGSRAIGLEHAGSDVDLVCVLPIDRPPVRLHLVCDGVPVSVNLIGPHSLGRHDPVLNGGFCFTRKLLGPRVLLAGDRADAQRLLMSAFGSMADPWALFSLPPVIQRITPEIALAALWLTAISVSSTFFVHIARWMSVPAFDAYWFETLALLGDAVERLQGVKGTLGDLDQYCRELRLESLRSAFWIQQYTLRHGDHGWPSAFVARHEELWTDHSASRQRILGHMEICGLPTDWLMTRLPL